jgi:hypothetical protein
VRAPPDNVCIRLRASKDQRRQASMTGLTDLKAAYVDGCNPLLGRSVLDSVRALLDELRTGKRLWRELALPARLRAAIGRLRRDRPSIPPVVLALRAFVASRMQAMLAVYAVTQTAAAALRPRGS